MSLLDYFRGLRKADTRSAEVAKERLQILISHERNGRDAPDYLPQLQREILAVVSKYVAIDHDRLKVKVESEDDVHVLEVNVTLPDS